MRAAFETIEEHAAAGRDMLGRLDHPASWMRLDVPRSSVVSIWTDGRIQIRKEVL